MKVYASRESVATADDVSAPNDRTFTFRDGTLLEDILRAIGTAGYLPLVEGGRATWTVTSKIPVAVVAQEWLQPKMLAPLDIDLSQLDIRDRILRLHFNYHAQIDPDVVYRVLWGFRLDAI